MDFMSEREQIYEQIYLQHAWESAWTRPRLTSESGEQSALTTQGLRNTGCWHSTTITQLPSVLPSDNASSFSPNTPLWLSENIQHYF